jgi:hypothetical protein
MMKRFLWVVNALPILGVVAIAVYVGVNQWSQSNQAIGAAPQVPSAQVPSVPVSNTEWGTVESVSDGDTRITRQLDSPVSSDRGGKALGGFSHLQVQCLS